MNINWPKLTSTLRYIGVIFIAVLIIMAYIGTVSVAVKNTNRASQVAFDLSHLDMSKASPPAELRPKPAPVFVIDPTKKHIAFTFDDGPSRYTSALLHILRTNNAKATFFMVGREVHKYPGAVRRVLYDGNEIGNHSWDHPLLTLLSKKDLKKQILSTQREIKKITGGYVPMLMRPPYGARNKMVVKYLKSQHLRMVLWNVDTNDWRSRNTKAVYKEIMRQAASKKVILLHDLYPTTVAAFKKAIPALQKKGYQLVTYSQLQKLKN